MIEDDLARKKAKEAEKAKDKDKKKSPKPQRRVVDAAAISPRRVAQRVFNVFPDKIIPDVCIH